MQVRKKVDSKLLDREYVEIVMEGKAGKLTRKDAVSTAAQEMGAQEDTVGLIRLEGQSGTTTVLGRFYVYGSADARKRLHPRHLGERALTKEEREKLKAERKKPKTPPPAPEAKK